MEVQWKQQIRRELRRRDTIQMGNYGSLVMSLDEFYLIPISAVFPGFTQKDVEDLHLLENLDSLLLEQREEASFRDSSQDPQKLREEVSLLLHHLLDLEREHARLLARVMEDKVKEAERMNESNFIAERYRQLKEKLQRIRAQRAKSCAISIAKCTSDASPTHMQSRQN